MQNQYYPFINEPLAYPYDFLEPYIDEETMRLHHDKHLQAYIDHLNRLLQEHPGFQKFSLEPKALPGSQNRSAVRLKTMPAAFTTTGFSFQS